MSDNNDNMFVRKAADRLYSTEVTETHMVCSQWMSVCTHAHTYKINTVILD